VWFVLEDEAEMSGTGSGTEVRVRRAGTGDVAEIVELSTALFREDAGRKDPFTNLGWPEEEGLAYFAGLVSGAGSVCLLAELEGRTVGYLAGRVGEGTTLRPVRVAELESMYVREGYRDLGVGARLVDGFLGWAGSRGAERASVVAYAANERAIRFYRRWGFRPRSVSLEREL
jgi:ribosomal protein S18 acetylase RimI-like enzyme